jgi:hypothetical protein
MQSPSAKCHWRVPMHSSLAARDLSHQETPRVSGIGDMRAAHYISLAIVAISKLVHTWDGGVSTLLEQTTFIGQRFRGTARLLSPPQTCCCQTFLACTFPCRFAP